MKIQIHIPGQEPELIESMKELYVDYANIFLTKLTLINNADSKMSRFASILHTEQQSSEVWQAKELPDFYDFNLENYEQKLEVNEKISSFE